jgi:hypothetical protein
MSESWRSFPMPRTTLWPRHSGYCAQGLQKKSDDHFSLDITEVPQSKRSVIQYTWKYCNYVKFFNAKFWWVWMFYDSQTKLTVRLFALLASNPAGHSLLYSESHNTALLMPVITWTVSQNTVCYCRQYKIIIPVTCCLEGSQCKYGAFININIMWFLLTMLEYMC